MSRSAMVGDGRRCNKCGDVKPLTEFYSWERRDKRGCRWSPCKPCLTEQTAEAQRAKKVYVDAYKIEHGCTDCGYNAHPAALDFDHLPGTLKLYTIRAGQSLGWKALLAEIEKCEVVCSNCHRIRTVTRNREEVPVLHG